MHFRLITAFVILNSGIAVAADYEYDVSGYGDAGYMHGEIESNRGSKEVEGYLYDEEGNSVYLDGEWTGRGEIEGYDKEGNYIEFEVD